MIRITGDYLPEDSDQKTNKRPNVSSWDRSSLDSSWRRRSRKPAPVPEFSINENKSDAKKINHSQARVTDTSQNQSQVDPTDAAYKYVNKLHIRENGKCKSSRYSDKAYEYTRKPGGAGNEHTALAIVSLIVFCAVILLGISHNQSKNLINSNQSASNKTEAPELQDENEIEDGEATQPLIQTETVVNEGEVDPAMEIDEYFTFERDEYAAEVLNSEDEYRRAAGDLARIQERMLRLRSKARYYPEILIGYSYWINEDSDQPIIGESTAGAYHLKEKLIQINFESDGFTYRKPIEVLTTLAHEYGHHLTEISIGINSLSGLESELVADCFAGVVMGYWAGYDKLSEAELKRAGSLMIRVSKHSESMTDDHGDPGQRLGAFLAGAMRASGKVTRPYKNFCVSLDEILDFNQELP